MTAPDAFIDKQAVLDAMAGRWESFYGQFTPLRPAGGFLRGPCPIHIGQGDNFSVDPQAGTWRCFSACGEPDDRGDALKFLQLRRGLPFREALDHLADFAGVAAPPPALSLSALPRPPKREVAAYDYTDESGAVLFQAVRYEPKGFGQRRPDGAGGWKWGLEGVRRVLYRLPEVAAAVAAGRPVYIAEGEKDADALAALGLAATTAPMGAGKWREEYGEALCGAGVVLLPDNDAPGRGHAEQVALALRGRAKRVRIVALPGLPEKGDVSDWLAAGGTRAALVQLVKAAADWTPPPEAPAVEEAPAPSAGKEPPKSIAERVISLRNIPDPPAELPYLFGPYLNECASHWLTGQTGIGKSTWLYNVLPALAEGRELWGIECKPRRILYLDLESGDVGRSMKAQRLFRDRSERPGLDNLLFLPEPLRFPAELPALGDYVEAERVDLVVFDTARFSFSVRDESDNAEFYARVVPVLVALKQRRVASLVMGHPAKNGDLRARGAGSQGEAVDVSLSLSMRRGEVGDRDGILALRVTKNRLLGLGLPPLYLRRVGGDMFERVEASEADQGGEVRESATKRESCQEALLDFLRGRASGSATHTGMEEAAVGAGFKTWAFNEAFKELRDGGQLTRGAEGAWLLADPFAEG